MPAPTTVQQGVKMRFYHSTLCPRRKCFVVRPHACRPPLRSAILSTCRFMNMPVRFAAMLSSTWPERSPINLRPVPPAVQRNWPSSSRRSRRQRRCPKHAAIAPARLPVRLHAREAAAAEVRGNRLDVTSGEMLNAQAARIAGDGCGCAGAARGDARPPSFASSRLRVRGERAMRYSKSMR